jgi:hypothetical protein
MNYIKNYYLCKSYPTYLSKAHTYFLPNFQNEIYELK